MVQVAILTGVDRESLNDSINEKLKEIQKGSVEILDIKTTYHSSFLYADVMIVYDDYDITASDNIRKECI